MNKWKSHPISWFIFKSVIVYLCSCHNSIWHVLPIRDSLVSVQTDLWMHPVWPSFSPLEVNQEWEATVKITSWSLSSSSQWEPSPSSWWWLGPFCAHGAPHPTRKSKKPSPSAAPCCASSSLYFSQAFIISSMFPPAENVQHPSPQTAPINTKGTPKTWSHLIFGSTTRGWSSSPWISHQTPTLSWQKPLSPVPHRTSRRLTVAWTATPTCSSDATPTVVSFPVGKDFKSWYYGNEIKVKYHLCCLGSHA